MRENQLKEYHLYGGDVVLSFDEDLHEYYYNGKVVPSTTKIIDDTLAKHALKFWAVKITLEWLQKQLIPGIKQTPESIEAILKSARFVHVRESEKATAIGSNAHKWIERFVELTMAGEDVEKNDVLLETIEAKNAVDAFLKWYSENEVEFIYSERKVYSIEHNFSGTFDLYAKVNGKRAIVDFKTSKHLYPDYLVQGAGYWLAFEEEANYKAKKKKKYVDQFIVLRLPKVAGDPWQTTTITDPTGHQEIFKMARKIYDWASVDLNNINPKTFTSE